MACCPAVMCRAVIAEADLVAQVQNTQGGGAMSTGTIILGALVKNPERGLTFEEICALPDFDDDEIDEVAEELEALCDEGAARAYRAGREGDDYEPRFHATLEGALALIAIEDDETWPDE